MGTVWGLLLGAGVFMVWWSFWQPHRENNKGRHGWYARTQDRLTLAGAASVTPHALMTISFATGLLVALVMSAMSTSVALGLAFGVLAARAPFALVTMRAQRRTGAMRDVWPEVVDHLASGIRAGMSLPEALSQLANKGPAEVREQFAQFAHDFRTAGRFESSLDALKQRLADPVADRIIEALRVTRDVGGTDIGHVLRALGEFLREDARMRSELEARQSWTINAARLAVAAPWLVLAMLSTRPDNAQAYNSPGGVTVLVMGGLATVVAYRMMIKIGRLPTEQRVLR